MLSTVFCISMNYFCCIYFKYFSCYQSEFCNLLLLINFLDELFIVIHVTAVIFKVIYGKLGFCMSCVNKDFNGKNL